LIVALDATYSVGDDLSGIGVYSREALWGLAAAHPEARFHFCYRPRQFLRSFRQPLPSNARRRLLLEDVPVRASLLHALNQRLPRARPPRTVSTFHDLFVLTGDYSTPEFRRRFTRQARDAAARSDAIIAVSSFTAAQVVGLLGVEPARVHVVHHGVRQPARTSAARENVVLHVGAIQKRKNLVRLVEAFERLPPDWSLVLAGSTSGYGAAEVLARQESSPARARIHVTGYLQPAELARCYARARIFAFPSLDEGFGMPVLEAMAAGVPVVASTRGALPEVCGDAAMLVDAESAESIAEALTALARSAPLREEYARRGTMRAAEFTWQKTVERIWAVYSSLGL
jgi:glycosyltransferase involved in cell wall biosynthesis